MSSFSEIIYLVKNLPRRGDGNNQKNSYTDRLLASIINTKRSELVKNDKDKGRFLVQDYIQTLGKVELIKASSEECCTFDCDLNEVFLRIKNPLPKVVDTNQFNLITYVGIIGGEGNFQRITYNELPYFKYAPFTGSKTKWFQLGNYIYIVQPKNTALKYITIKGVFEDPELAHAYNECGCAEDCFIGYDFPYPMRSSDISTVIKMIAASELAMNSMLPKDDTNDGKDD